MTQDKFVLVNRGIMMMEKVLYVGNVKYLVKNVLVSKFVYLVLNKIRENYLIVPVKKGKKKRKLNL